MNGPIQVWMPECWMENHREQEHTDALRHALKMERVYVVDSVEPGNTADCDLAFAGSWKYYDIIGTFRRLFPSKPVVHYNWDLYPFQLNERTDPRTDRTRTARPTANATRWAEYLEELKLATEVWVPSTGVVRRTEEFTGRSARVIKCNAFLWEVEDRKSDWWTVLNVDLSVPYVVDVMRQYPEESMVGAVAEVCRELGVPCVQTDHRLTWDEFRCVVKNAALLVSAYKEASTGGLTLLEGHAHGVEVLLSDSPYQGAGEYFGARATYFDCRQGRVGLRNTIKFLMELPPLNELERERNVRECREWVLSRYGIEAFAKRLAAGFRGIL